MSLHTNIATLLTDASWLIFDLHFYSVLLKNIYIFYTAFLLQSQNCFSVKHEEFKVNAGADLNAPHYYLYYLSFLNYIINH